MEEKKVKENSNCNRGNSSEWNWCGCMQGACSKGIDIFSRTGQSMIERCMGNEHQEPFAEKGN